MLTSGKDDHRLLGRDFSDHQSSSKNDINYLSPVVNSKNDINYLLPMVSDGGNENPLDSNSGRDDEGDGSPKMEDSEVRMDLTDDLLHMVFIN